MLDLRPPVRLDLWAAVLAAGIVAGTVLPALGAAIVVASVIVCAGALVWRELVPLEWRPMALLSPLFAAAGAGIALLHAAAPDPLAELAAIEPGEVVLVGRLTSPPVETGYGYRADLRVEHLWHEGQEVLRGGGVEVFAADISRLGVGDRVRVDGEISLPESGGDGFNYARYLSTRRVSAVVEAARVWPVEEKRGLVGRIHRRTDVALGYGLRPREAAVVRGMVLGDRSRIPEELETAFRRSGITHILAISGQHVAVLTAILYFLLRGLSVPLVPRVVATGGLIWAYIFVAGAPPSAIRAGVVATLILAAQLCGRRISPLHLLTVMLTVVLSYNPQLVYSTGFQLSVAAVAGILLLRKPMRALVEATLFRPMGRPPRAVAELLSASLAAQIATAPIVASVFGEVSLIGVLTNLVAVPLSGPILTLGMLGAFVGNAVSVAAYPLNAVNGFLVTFLEWTARSAAAMPFAVALAPGVTPLLVAAFYAGCLPAALAGAVFPEERWSLWAGLTVVWVVLWLAVVGTTSG